MCLTGRQKLVHKNGWVGHVWQPGNKHVYDGKLSEKVRGIYNWGWEMVWGKHVGAAFHNTEWSSAVLVPSSLLHWYISGLRDCYRIIDTQHSLFTAHLSYSGRCPDMLPCSVLFRVIARISPSLLLFPPEHTYFVASSKESEIPQPGVKSIPK